MSSETDQHLALWDSPVSLPAAESDETESEKQTATQPAIPPSAKWRTHSMASGYGCFLLIFQLLVSSILTNSSDN